MAPIIQKRRASAECGGTGMLNQLRANEPLHQRCSFSRRSRARRSTAILLSMISGDRRKARAGIGKPTRRASAAAYGFVVDTVEIGVPSNGMRSSRHGVTRGNIIAAASHGQVADVVHGILQSQ